MPSRGHHGGGNGPMIPIWGGKSAQRWRRQVTHREVNGGQRRGSDRRARGGAPSAGDGRCGAYAMESTGQDGSYASLTRGAARARRMSIARVRVLRSLAPSGSFPLHGGWSRPHPGSGAQNGPRSFLDPTRCATQRLRTVAGGTSPHGTFLDFVSRTHAIGPLPVTPPPWAHSMTPQRPGVRL